MFEIYNKTSNVFQNRVIYSIEDIMTAYKMFIDNKNEDGKHEPVFYKNISITKHSDYMYHLYKIYEKEHEFRCSICGCKANHFRLMSNIGSSKESNREIYHLFGIHHVKGTNDATYLLFNRDHIVPASKDGSNSYMNMRLACERCNTMRGNDMKFIYDESVINNELMKFKAIIRTALNKGVSNYFGNSNRKNNIYHDKILSVIRLFRDNNNAINDELLKILNKG